MSPQEQEQEKNFPGYREDMREIFGNDHVDILKISKWKTSWYQKTPNQFIISSQRPGASICASPARYPVMRREIDLVARQCGIHPYFWDYWMAKEQAGLHDTSYGIINGGLKPGEIEPWRSEYAKRGRSVSFYKEEHLVLFKLAW